MSKQLEETARLVRGADVDALDPVSVQIDRTGFEADSVAGNTYYALDVHPTIESLEPEGDNIPRLRKAPSVGSLVHNK